MPTSTAVLRVEGVEKSFPGVHALKGVDFDVRPGEIHALVGENGAGKSTLMRILSGVYRADTGRIVVDGREVVVRSPAEGFALGIAMVYQDTRLAPTLDVAWNVALGHEPGGVFVNRRAMRADAAAALASLGADIGGTRTAAALSRAESQYVEIARAISRDARVLILDEPTSALTSAETERLFEVLANLRRQGRAIVFISHRIPEVLALADRITVMKDGEVVGTLAASAATPDRLVAMMVGRDVALAFPKRAGASGRTVLIVDSLSAGRAEDVSFALRAGEIVGFGGVEGAGQRDSARGIFGLDRTAGRLTLNGEPFDPTSAAEAIVRGLVYVPADRRRESLFLPHGIRENVGVPHLSRFLRGGLIDKRAETAAVAAEADRLAIRTPSLEQPVALLSGGNQQKVVFARWFLGDAAVYVFDEPTQGVDVATKLELYRLIRERAAEGAAVVVVSSDVVELIGLSDRILVFAGGRIVDEVPAAEATEERIVGAAVARARVDAHTVAALRARNRDRLLLDRYLPALLLAVLVIGLGSVATFFSPYFLTDRNAASLAVQLAPLVFAALGQLTVLLLGGIDLSIGPTISLTTAIASYALVDGGTLPVPLGIATCLGAGLAVGLVNGLLIVALRIPDLIATLATYIIVQGVALIVRPSPGGFLNLDVADAILGSAFGIPFVFAAAIILVVLAEALLSRGRVGGWLYGAGSSAEAAAVAGVPVARLRLAAYAVSGLLASIAGLIIAARIGTGDPQSGTTFTLASVTAVVVGGASVFGGVGTAVGALLGAALVILMQNVLNLLHVSAYWQYIWTGALTLLAVGFYGLRSAQSRRVAGTRLARLVRGSR